MQRECVRGAHIDLRVTAMVSFISLVRSAGRNAESWTAARTHSLR